nr:hypothetical protein BaRGS_025825 [Batillaria attramentaria]
MNNGRLFHDNTEFMEDLGLGDVDDISEFRDLIQGEDASDWDSTVAEETPAPPLPSSPQPKLAKVSEWEDDVERIVVPTPAGQIPKEVEVMMRRQQAEAQDTDEDDSSSQHNDVKAVGASDLLSVTIEQSAKEYLDRPPPVSAKPTVASSPKVTLAPAKPMAGGMAPDDEDEDEESGWDSDQAEAARQAEEEQERKKKEEEEEEQQRRQQQWEREEAARQERLRAEAEEALRMEQEAMGDDDKASSEDDSLAHEEYGKPCVVRAFISESERPTIMFEYQRFLLGDLGRIVLREELKRIEEQVREEARAKEVAALIASSSATTVSGRPSQHSTSSGAQVVLHPQPSQGLPQQSNSGSYLTGPTALQIKQRLQIGSGNPHMAYHSDGMESDDSLASDNERPDNIHSYYPTLGSTQSFRPDFNMADDDILSYTSTEFENDPSTLVQVQDYIRETKRHMEQERNQRAVLENKLRLITKEKQDMQSELEAKQRAELTMRNIQLEMRAAQNTIKELEEEREELERQLQHEHNARMLQEQINEEQSRLAQQRHQETMASAMAASRLEARPGEDGTDGEGRGERDKLNAELYAIKMEMDRQRSRFKDEITLMATENEELQSRVEELKSEIKLNEEALAHATMQYNMQLGTLRSEGSTAAAAIEKERAAREKLEAELESLQKRLLSANTEKDRAVQARNELEHDYQREKQSALRDKERKDEELAMLKDNNQLHVSNTSLMERTNQLQQLRQEADRHKQAQENFDTNIRLEKVRRILSQSQHEVLSLKQQVENLRTAGLNSSSADSHEQLTAIMASLHADSDRSKAILEERSNNLMEQVQHLKEEARNADNRRNTLEADLRRLQTEHTEVRHKLSLAEAQLQMMQKAKDQLEQERGQLKLELEKATEKQHASQEKAVEAQARVAELTERLDRAERASQLSTQNLATTSASYNAVARTKDEMEDTLQRLQVENARLDSDLRHERERAEMLQAELTDSYKVRSSLEALCSNLKSTTAHLEEKLGAKKSSSEAEGHKSVLESQLMEESQKNQQLQKEVTNLKSLLKAAKKKMKSQVDGGFVDVEGLQQDMETKYRRELNRKLEEVNAYLETQTRARDRLDSSRSENEARITADKRRLEEENSNLRLQYEQALAQRESREMEARRFKQLYESEMQWRMRLSDQLQQSDRLKSRLHGSVGNLNMSAMSDASVNVSRINGDREEALSNKIRAELDRSIAKHLEAAPHSDIVPVIRETEGALLNQSLAKSSKDYIEILKRKYCV